MFISSIKVKCDLLIDWNTNIYITLDYSKNIKFLRKMER